MASISGETAKEKRAGFLPFTDKSPLHSLRCQDRPARSMSEIACLRQIRCYYRPHLIEAVNDKRVGAACYLAGILFPIVSPTTEPYKSNRFLRFHSWESIIAFLLFGA
jgi:hypothetical protein